MIFWLRRGAIDPPRLVVGEKSLAHVLQRCHVCGSVFKEHRCGGSESPIQSPSDSKNWMGEK